MFCVKIWTVMARAPAGGMLSVKVWTVMARAPRLQSGKKQNSKRRCCRRPPGNHGTFSQAHDNRTRLLMVTRQLLPVVGACRRTTPPHEYFVIQRAFRVANRLLGERKEKKERKGPSRDIPCATGMAHVMEQVSVVSGRNVYVGWLVLNNCELVAKGTDLGNTNNN